MSDYKPLNEDERALMTHVNMFGSAGYPLAKLGSGWVWGFRSIKGPPKVFKRKKDAVENFELYMSLLRERYGAERQEQAFADERARHAKGTCLYGNDCPLKGET